MRRVVLACLLALIPAASVWAASYSVNTTTLQDGALSWMTDKTNVQRANQTPPLPPVSGQDVLQAVVNGFLDGWVKDKAKADLCSALTDSQRATLVECR